MSARTLGISKQVDTTAEKSPGPGRPNKRRGKKCAPVRRETTRNSGNLGKSKLCNKGVKGDASEAEGGNDKTCSKPSMGLGAPRSAKKGERENPSACSTSTLKGLKVVSPSLRRAGEYRLGPMVGCSPVKCVEQYLARKDGTDQFYVIKMLTRKVEGEKETADGLLGKTLIHTEHSLLSLLQNEPGVIREHGLFNDTIEEEFVNESGMTMTKQVRRVCLVVDCFTGHQFSPKYGPVTNMHLYVIEAKKLKEAEAIRIFFKVVKVVERLHKLNIVHRDLKLGNIILNQETKEVYLANFCLGNHLGREEEPLKDQKGSPAYISPEVIYGKPYLGKPSDMWGLGVVLYAMLYGHFPFYDPNPTKLLQKIKLGEFRLPLDVNVSQKTIELIKSLLHLDSRKRLTASVTLDKVKSIIAEEEDFLTDINLQIVPDCPLREDGRPMKRKCSCSAKERMLNEEQKRSALISPNSSSNGATGDDDNQRVPGTGINPICGKMRRSEEDGEAVVPTSLRNNFCFPVTTCSGGGWVRIM